jgi:hypothetical protein
LFVIHFEFSGINSPNLDANFITQLGVLGQKLAFLSTYKNFTAVQESTDGIERLKMKVCLFVGLVPKMFDTDSRWFVQSGCL